MRRILAALVVAALVGCGASTHTQVAHVAKNRFNHGWVKAPRPPRPTGGFGGFITVQAALDATPSGGMVTFPHDGIYPVATPLIVPSNITVDGNGSVLKTPANSTTSSSDDEIMQVSSGDTIRNFTFDGNVHNQSGLWNQHRHAIRVTSVSDVRISYNTFRNLIGDGVYATSAANLTIDHNQFSGDHSNRNGISIISGSNVTIHDNTFWSMARPDMPGAIDIEPNLLSQSVSTIRVYNNTVNGPAHYGILIWNAARGAITSASITNNTINCGSAAMNGGAGILVGWASATVSGNDINNCTLYNGIEWDYAPGGSTTSNHINGAYIGVNRRYSPSVTVSDNTDAHIVAWNEFTDP